MTIMQQMNLFNTSSEVAGFKLDYLEVWNWGTFDKKVYHMNLHGNNSLLTGANASGKSTLIDALLTLMVPLKRQRFYNQSSVREHHFHFWVFVSITSYFLQQVFIFLAVYLIQRINYENYLPAIYVL